MDKLIDLALKMPPIISAALSLLVLVVVWRLGKKIFTEMEGVSKKLEDASTKLAAIEVQTTKTNGSVLAIEAWRTGHDRQDDERHEEIGAKHDENKERFQVVFDKLDRIEAKGGA